ncbi:MAG: hypothetical protein NTU44_18015 [Bacteroidetes bacterium]|nr:hypothetical protein [Bacteroidota bacterium]
MRLTYSSKPWSLATVWLLFAVALYLRFYFPISNIISWDVFGYYLYLPAQFIHHDLGIKDVSWVKQLISQYHNTSTFYQAFPGTDGSIVIKYSMGMALVYSPFFFVAHWLAPVMGYPADGLSMPYQYAMVVCGLVWSLAGILLLRKLLLRFFTDMQTVLVILAIVAGTNYAEMVYANGLLTHNTLFTLYALFFILSMNWYEKRRKATAAALGLTVGLITLIRPTDMMVLILPLLWGVTGPSAIKEKWKFFRKEYKSLLFFILCMVVVGLPQLLYWKAVTGKFLYYSYINPGEGFDFFYPHTPDFLFSFRKGWLIYTPVMFFALAGFYEIYKRARYIFWPLLIFLVVYVYVVSSWSCWYYAGSFSQRPMAQVYPFLAIPLGFMFVRIQQMMKLKKWLLTGIVTFFILLNIFQLWQYSFAWIIDAYRMTPAYYFRTFGKIHPDPKDRELLLVERSAEADEYLTNTAGYTRRTLCYLDFEKKGTSVDSKIIDTLGFSGKHSLVMDSTLIYSPGLSLPYKEITRHYYAWIRASVWVYSPDTPNVNPVTLVVTFMHKDGNYKYRGVDLENPKVAAVKGKWNLLTIDYMTPEVRTKRDKLTIYCWLRGKKPVLIDDLKVEVFEPLN